MIIKVYVIDNFAESFIADSTTKVNNKHSIIWVGGSSSSIRSFVFKELSEVGRFMGDYTLMSWHLKAWDQHLFFLSPVTFSYLEVLLLGLLQWLQWCRGVVRCLLVLYINWLRLGRGTRLLLLLLLSSRPSLIWLLLLKLRLTLTWLLLRL